MTDWKSNAAMFWSTDGTTWNKITDHNRDVIDVSITRIEKVGRMVDGTLRRYTVAKKRSFGTSWTMLPSKSNVGIGTADGGWAGENIESFHNANNGAFFMKLRKGSDDGKAANDGTIETVTVMITDFSKTIEKRGIVDFWTLSITLEEV